jgi:hypothetical protein
MGEDAWLTVKFQSGRFKVTIESDGVWKGCEWKYVVKQTDGELFENGSLVAEDDLYSSEK